MRTSRMFLHLRPHSHCHVAPHVPVKALRVAENYSEDRIERVGGPFARLLSAEPEYSHIIRKRALFRNNAQNQLPRNLCLF